MSKQPPPAPTASAVGPCPTLIQNSRTPRHWKFTQHHRTTRPPPGPDGIVTVIQKTPVALLQQMCLYFEHARPCCVFFCFVLFCFDDEDLEIRKRDCRGMTFHIKNKAFGQESLICMANGTKCYHPTREYGHRPTLNSPKRHFKLQIIKKWDT